MAICKFCQKPFAWGVNDGKYTPLVPVEEHDGLPRVYQDENGILRAEHRAVCVMRGGPTVRVSRLAVAVPASDVLSVPTRAMPQVMEAAQSPPRTILDILEEKRIKQAAKKAKRAAK